MTTYLINIQNIPTPQLYVGQVQSQPALESEKGQVLESELGEILKPE